LPHALENVQTATLLHMIGESLQFIPCEKDRVLERVSRLMHHRLIVPLWRSESVVIRRANTTRSMTIQNISRLAALVAKHFHETPRFDYRVFRDRQAEGSSFPFGSFILILRRQDLGLALPPEIFQIPDGYELRQGREVIAKARRPEAFGRAYSHRLENEAEYLIFTPGGGIFSSTELLERQKTFLKEAVEDGFQLGAKCRLLVTAGKQTDDHSFAANPPWMDSASRGEFWKAA
jgi:hypothetical protein